MDDIVLAGTFDVENYGDLLFPLLVRRRIPNSNVRAVSPAGAGPVWSDSTASKPLESLSESHCGAVIIGGGNIIRLNRSTLQYYGRHGVDVHGYADLWIGTALSAAPGVPVLWNAPGVPRPIETEFITIVRKAMQRADYISVRDATSRGFLLDVYPEAEITIRPDPAWEIPSLWSAEDLDAEFQAMTDGSNDDFVAIHLNDRYTRDISRRDLVIIIDEICSTLGARAILIGIGPCHGDDAYARDLAPDLARTPLLMDRPGNLKAVCAAISRSQFYAGSSMHGYITAATFGVPALLIARRMIKFEGVAQRAGAPETLLDTWTAVPEAIRSTDRAALSKRFRARQSESAAELDAHWARITKHLDEARDLGSRSFDASQMHAYRAEFYEAACRLEMRRTTEQKEIAQRAREKAKTRAQEKRSVAETAPRSSWLQRLRARMK